MVVTRRGVRVYRVQATDGRGPWRPGFSREWIDGDAPAGRLTQNIFDLVPARTLLALPRHLHYGCACRTMADLLAWFTPLEYRRLEQLGFYPVALAIDVIVVESEWQMLVGRERHFSDGASRRSWPQVSRQQAAQPLPVPTGGGK
jgi:hypothetical protein